jgi:hypothetical protein
VTRLIERVTRLERRLGDVDASVDEIDRWHRPYGDGTRVPPRRRRGR